MRFALNVNQILLLGILQWLPIPDPGSSPYNGRRAPPRPDLTFRVSVSHWPPQPCHTPSFLRALHLPLLCPECSSMTLRKTYWFPYHLRSWLKVRLSVRPRWASRGEWELPARQHFPSALSPPSTDLIYFSDLLLYFLPAVYLPSVTDLQYLKIKMIT